MDGNKNNNNTQDGVETMTKTITWTGSTDKTATIEIKVVEGSPMMIDGKMSPQLSLEGLATVDGQFVTRGIPRRINHPQVAGSMGGKLGIPEVQMVQIETAIEDLKDTPEWRAYDAQVKANLADVEEQDSRHARIIQTMGR